MVVYPANIQKAEGRKIMNLRPDCIVTLMLVWAT